MRSGAITLFDQGMVTLIHMVSVVVLARLLTPGDYGTVTMVTAVTGIVNLFRELGLSSATVRTRGITHEQVSNLFWINAGAGAAVTLIIAASGPILAWFYHKPQLTLVAIGVSLTSVLSSLGTQHGALINRDMRFGTMAVIRNSALLAGLVAALVVAFAGGTYWALVASAVVTAAWDTTGRWIASGFRPGRYKKGVGLRPLIRFGANVAGSDIVTYFHRNTDNILIGKAWGAGQLGLYTKAYSLLMLPISNLRSPLNRVAFPAMSRLQDQPAAFRAYFAKYCSLLSFITMPIVAYLFASSEHVIRLLLGPRWIGASELFSILAIVSFIQAPAGLKGIVQTAMGRGGRLFRLTLISARGGGVLVCYRPPLGRPRRGHRLLLQHLLDSPSDPHLRFPRHAGPPLRFLPVRHEARDLEHRHGRRAGARRKPPEGISGRPPARAHVRGGSDRSTSAFFILLPGGKRALAGYWEYVTILRKGALSTFARLGGGGVPDEETGPPEDVKDQDPAGGPGN